MSVNTILTDPKQVQITAPVGGLVAGDAYFDGCRFGVCENDIAAGEVGYMTIAADVRELAFAGGTTPAKNAKAYWDPTAKKIYSVWDSGRILCGSFYAAAATDDATCQIMLDGGVVDEYEKGDITGVEPGDGLTGGGVSGSVELAVDFGTGAKKVCEGNDGRLSDARTPTAHAASHATAGTDAITPAAIGACADNDARLSDARTPTAHADSHKTAGADALSAADIGAADALHSHDADAIAYTNGAVPGVTEVEGVLDAIIDYIRVLPQVKQIVVAPGATSGTSVGDTSLIGGRVTGIVPVSGNDQPVASVAIDGTTGVITLTLAAASTAEATFDVWVQPVLPA